MRGYLGDTANRKMRDTLDNEPDKFYFYNNGISAICTEIVPELDEKGVKAFVSGPFIDLWFPKIHNTIAKCIKKNYQTSKRNEGDELPSFNFKNWLRNTSDFYFYIPVN